MSREVASLRDGLPLNFQIATTPLIAVIGAAVATRFR
jgi:hypothetical protein